MSASILPKWFQKLDTVVKLGLAVFVGSFMLIWGGMYLTRPDRSIPPYSIGSQEGTAVAMHVPLWTSDTEIETLLHRIQKIAREGRDFGRMKIQPTTPTDKAGRYQRMTIYIFAHDSWAEQETLHRYLVAKASGNPAEQAFSTEFEKTVRGYYRLDEKTEEGRLGRIYEALSGQESVATAAHARLLFKGPVISADVGSMRSPSPRRGAPAAPGR
jgi:hypothetical protein